MSASKKTYHRRFIGENKLEEYDLPMTKHHWVKHKKESIDFVDDAPFVLDRQLEDQRFQIRKNRNPQLDVLTKAEKTKSELALIKKGATRTIAMKAKVLNKIVREESGVHTYTLVPPPRQLDDKKKETEPVDPETHPLFRPYALEAHQKPVIMSFGHRPTSASRTFNPATMKVRLKHGEIAKQERPNASGFGIPVAVLTKVLHAPDLPRPGTEFEETSPSKSKSFGPLDDPNNLFPSETDMESLGINRRKVKKIPKSMSAPSNTATAAATASRGALSAGMHTRSAHSGTGTGTSSPPLSPTGSRLSPYSKVSIITNSTKQSKSQKHVEKKEWDDTCTLQQKPIERLRMKLSVINPKGERTITERLNRYAKLSVPEALPAPFCTEKHENDKITFRTGKPIPAKAPVPFMYEEEPLRDMTKGRIVRLQKEFKKETEKRDKKIGKTMYGKAATEIPDVQYNPFTALKLMKSEEGRKLFLDAAETGLPTAYLTSDLSRQHDTERAFVMALNAARGGNKHALADFYKNIEELEGTVRPLIGSGAVDGHGDGDGNYGDGNYGSSNYGNAAEYDGAEAMIERGGEIEEKNFQSWEDGIERDRLALYQAVDSVGAYDADIAATGASNAVADQYQYHSEDA